MSQGALHSYAQMRLNGSTQPAGRARGCAAAVALRRYPDSTAAFGWARLVGVVGGSTPFAATDAMVGARRAEGRLDGAVGALGGGHLYPWNFHRAGGGKRKIRCRCGGPRPIGPTQTHISVSVTGWVPGLRGVDSIRYPPPRFPPLPSSPLPSLPSPPTLFFAYYRRRHRPCRASRALAAVPPPAANVVVGGHLSQWSSPFPTILDGSVRHASWPRLTGLAGPQGPHNAHVYVTLSRQHR